MTRLTAEQMAEMRERAKGNTSYPDTYTLASEDRRALLRHVEAVEGELAELQTQRRDWLDKDTTARTLVSQERIIASLEADLAACRRDAERLIWLFSDIDDVLSTQAKPQAGDAAGRKDGEAGER